MKLKLFTGMWGAPTFSATMFVGMLAATVTSILESIGDYYVAAKACAVPAPPTHAVNRGIAAEGIGAFLCGLFGAAHATTSYSSPTALIRLTGVLTHKHHHHHHHLHHRHTQCYTKVAVWRMVATMVRPTKLLYSGPG